MVADASSYARRDPKPEAALETVADPLEPLCSSGWRILENGREIHKGQRQLGLPVSGFGQDRPDGRFLPEPKSRCELCQGLSPQWDEEPAHTHQDHARRLRGIAECGK